MLFRYWFFVWISGSPGQIHHLAGQTSDAFISVAEPHHFDASSGKNFDAAPTPTLLKQLILKLTKFTIFSSDFWIENVVL
jgi:hypothetical protein